MSPLEIREGEPYQPPTSLEEYTTRFLANQEISGYFTETRMTVPCPFCAFPGFQSYRILEVERVMAEEATCSACGRSAKAIVQRSDGGVSFEIVQTGGPEQPEWLEPKMRRV